MSRIYFHSPSGEAEVLGAERSHVHLLVNDTSAERITRHPNSYREPLRELTRDSHLKPQSRMIDQQFLQDFILSFRVRGDGSLLAWRGHALDAFALALNTAIDWSGESMRLVARLDGQCEIHSYVEGKNRAWLADRIQDALDYEMLRPGMGWESPPEACHARGPGVIPLLRSRDDEPVVLSYSVCDSFPYAAHVVMPLPPEDWRPDGWTEQEWADLDEDARDDYRDECRIDTFGNLPEQEQWARGMDWLRERSQTMRLELRPDDWRDYRFGHRLSLLDLERADWRDRVETALSLVPS
ncbi:hypothetical protein [Streptomyces sp.]|uniref:hypothetical protein n=1 Tax=Streptomyces sp. TaxID=1931 RepID=UPI002F94CFE3